MGSFLISKDCTDKRVIKKIVNTKSGEITSIVQQNNNFFYHLENMATSCDDGRSKQHKKDPTDNIDDKSSTTSVPSVSTWGTKQNILFNIHFFTLKSTYENAFCSFFRIDDKKIHQLPKKFDELLKTNLGFNNYEKPASNQQITKLAKQSEHFQLTLSEAAACNVVQTILEQFEETPYSKIKMRYGVADFVLYKNVKGLRYMFCVIEVKGSSAYDALYRARCRNQLGAYMVSAAVGNYEQLLVADENDRFGSQEIFGVLHIGLTPIFYRASVEDKYIESILNGCFDDLPELKIEEFIVSSPYTDRDFFNPMLRPKFISAFNTLLNYKFELDE